MDTPANVLRAQGEFARLEMAINAIKLYLKQVSDAYFVKWAEDLLVELNKRLGENSKLVDDFLTAFFTQDSHDADDSIIAIYTNMDENQKISLVHFVIFQEGITIPIQMLRVRRLLTIESDSFLKAYITFLGEVLKNGVTYYVYRELNQYYVRTLELLFSLRKEIKKNGDLSDTDKTKMVADFISGLSANGINNPTIAEHTLKLIDACSAELRK